MPTMTVRSIVVSSMAPFTTLRYGPPRIILLPPTISMSSPCLVSTGSRTMLDVEKACVYVVLACELAPNNATARNGKMFFMRFTLFVGAGLRRTLIHPWLIVKCRSSRRALLDELPGHGTDRRANGYQRGTPGAPTYATCHGWWYCTPAPENYSFAAPRTPMSTLSE